MNTQVTLYTEIENDVCSIFIDNVKVGRAITLEDRDEKEFYCNCDYVIEDDSVVTYSTIEGLHGEDLPNLLCINMRCDGLVEFEPLQNLIIGRCAEHIKLRANLYFDLANWMHDFNLFKFIDPFSLKMRELQYQMHEGPWFDDNIFYLTFLTKLESKRTIGTQIREIASQLLTMQHEVLQGTFDIEGFATRLSVPDKYRHAFAHYLAYFSQFLSDIGVESDTTVTCSESEIILNVIPRNKDEALSKIHLALASYISLTQGLSVISPYDDQLSKKKYEQVLANVEFLRQQLNMGRNDASEIEQDIRTLSTLDKGNRALLNYNESKQSREVPTYWEPIEGIKITKYKGKFFEIDVPLLLRKLFRK